jgi:nucleotide-binding universal stress UspA family protein
MTRDIKNILFATDFSDSSQQTADYAVTFATLTDAKLHVLHVINELNEHQRVMIPRDAFLVLKKDVVRPSKSWRSSAGSKQRD